MLKIAEKHVFQQFFLLKKNTGYPIHVVAVIIAVAVAYNAIV